MNCQQFRNTFATLSFCCLIMSGCGTVVHQLSLTTLLIPPGTAPSPYGGVEMDLAAASHPSDESPPSAGEACLAALAIIDLPLSAVADTALLPFWALGYFDRVQTAKSANAAPRQGNLKSTEQEIQREAGEKSSYESRGD